MIRQALAWPLFIAVTSSLSGQSPPDAPSARLVRLVAHRFGKDPACAVAYHATGSPILLTTYGAIRGADRLSVFLAAGTDVGERATVAAYGVGDDVAILRAEGIGDSVPRIAQTPAQETGVSVWGFGADQQPVRTDVHARAGTGSRISIRGALPACFVGAPLLDSAEGLIGLVADSMTAVSSAVVARIAEASRASSPAQLSSVREVADRERHRYGTTLLRSSVAGGSVRVQPLESWQWPSAGATGALPFSFSGPMGRYQVDLMLNGVLANRSSFEMQPGVSIQVTLSGGTGGKKKGSRLPLWISGAGAAGAGAAALLLSAGGGGPSGGPPGGGIAVTVPVWHP